jgi:hypothetical protein
LKVQVFIILMVPACAEVAGVAEYKSLG